MDRWGRLTSISWPRFRALPALQLADLAAQMRKVDLHSCEIGLLRLQASPWIYRLSRCRFVRTFAPQHADADDVARPYRPSGNPIEVLVPEEPAHLQDVLLGSVEGRRFTLLSSRRIALHPRPVRTEHAVPWRSCEAEPPAVQLDLVADRPSPRTRAGDRRSSRGVLGAREIVSRTHLYFCRASPFLGSAGGRWMAAAARMRRPFLPNESHRCGEVPLLRRVTRPTPHGHRMARRALGLT